MLLQADSALIPLSDKSIHCVVCSPPYWGLRKYTGEQDRGLFPNLGLEKTPQEHIERLVMIFREIRRVLRDDGVVWLNYGDCYAGGGRGVSETPKQASNKGHVGAMPSYKKIEGGNLMLMPHRIAIALQDDGCIIRNDLVWRKCLSHSTKVYSKTQKGVMPTPIGDLARLDPSMIELWTGSEWSRVLELEKVEKESGIEIEFRNGQRITSTENHRWVLKDGQIVEARNLTLGMKLESVTLPEGNYQSPNLPDDLIGWFIGLYIAEGSMGKDGKVIQIASHLEELDRYRKLKKLANLYDGTCKMHRTSDGYAATINLYGEILTGIIDHYVSGKTAKNKHLNVRCWRRSNRFLQAVLDGYLEGDGHYEELTGLWRLGFTRNDMLADNLRTICARLGYSVRLWRTWHQAQDKKHYGFIGTLQIDLERRRTDDWEIVGLQKSKSRAFYHIAIEAPHVFALADGLLTHNSNPMPESVAGWRWEKSRKEKRRISGGSKQAKNYKGSWEGPLSGGKDKVEWEYTDDHILRQGSWRHTRAHEYVFQLSKKMNYYSNGETVREVAGRVFPEPSFQRVGMSGIVQFSDFQDEIVHLLNYLWPEDEALIGSWPPPSISHSSLSQVSLIFARFIFDLLESEHDFGLFPFDNKVGIKLAQYLINLSSANIPAIDYLVASCSSFSLGNISSKEFLQKLQWFYINHCNMKLGIESGTSPFSLESMQINSNGNTAFSIDYTSRISEFFSFVHNEDYITEQQPRQTSGRNPRSVLDVPTSPYSGAHYACVDDKTEALTRAGWKRYDQLENGELIACYRPEHNKLAWNAANFHVYDYDGEMVSIEKRETSQLLTPNHRCFIRRRKGHQGSDGWKTDTIEAKDLYPAYELLLSADFVDLGAEPIGENWAALVGWYITEGYRRHKNDVGIDQSLIANPENVDTIRFLLDSVDANYSETKLERTWRGRPADMMQFIVKGNTAIRLKELAPEKKMTPRLANLQINEAKILFDTLIAADGNVRNDGRLQFIQKDKDCIDLIQLLAIRLGYKTVLSQRKSGVYSLFMTKKRWLTLRGTNGKHEPLPRTYYKGIVWCPSTPTGYWLARRNGKTFITGNTFPPNLIAPLIRASCPRRCCPECGQAWAPVMEKKSGYSKECPKTQASHEARGGNGIPQGTVGKSGSGRIDGYSKVIGYRPTCSCEREDYVPGIVLDPFVGSGTTVQVARELLRTGIGLDISMEYLDEQAKVRAGLGSPRKQLDDLPLFTYAEENGVDL